MEETTTKRPRPRQPPRQRRSRSPRPTSRSRPPTVTIDAAGTYTFEATNDGGTDHALEIEGNGIEEETDTIGPGESASVTVDLEAGTYEMYCPIDGHRDQGMEGEITVS